MADEQAVTKGGTRTLLVTSSSGETRRVHSETVGSENRVLVAAHVKALTGSILQNVLNIGTIAIKIPASPLASRKVLVIKNASEVVVFIGNSAVSTINGFPLAAASGSGTGDGGEIVLDVDNTIDVYGVVASGTEDVRFMEIS